METEITTREKINAFIISLPGCPKPRRDIEGWFESSQANLWRHFRDEIEKIINERKEES